MAGYFLNGGSLEDSTVKQTPFDRAKKDAMGIVAGATVLFVEDEAMIRLLGTEILEDAGYSVIEAANADEAVVLLTKHSDVQLLFSDIDMPGTMDGVALARLVHGRWPDIKLLLTSGKHQVAEENIPDHGKFLPKPWTIDELLGKVTTALAA
jgi:CheY-like chemotaxis protein